MYPKAAKQKKSNVIHLKNLKSGSVGIVKFNLIEQDKAGSFLFLKIVLCDVKRQHTKIRIRKLNYSNKDVSILVNLKDLKFEDKTVEIFHANLERPNLNQQISVHVGVLDVHFWLECANENSKIPLYWKRFWNGR